MRGFIIDNGRTCIDLDETDIFGIIGCLLSEVSQMDSGDEIILSCYGDFGKEGVNKDTES